MLYVSLVVLIPLPLVIILRSVVVAKRVTAEAVVSVVAAVPSPPVISSYTQSHINNLASNICTPSLPRSKNFGIGVCGEAARS